MGKGNKIIKLGGGKMQRILVDYLTLSVSMSCFNVDNICSLVGIKRDEFTEIKSRLGLNNCLYYGGIKIHYHEISEDIKKPLIVLDMSGQGCRLLETIKKDDVKFNWIDFIEHFLSTEGSHIARLDIACDDKVESEMEKPLLSFPLMVKHIIERRYISQANRKIYTDGDEQNIIFGAPSSDRRLRIYNKALERGFDGHWIRAEFQLRNESALSFYMRALERSDIGQAYYGLLYAYLRFTKEENDVNHTERLTVTRWWNTFCHGAEKIKGFYLGGCEYNMQSLQDYIRNQSASSLKTFLEIKEGDFGSLLGLFENSKLNKKQQYLIKVEKLNQELEQNFEKEEQLRHEIERDYDIV